MARSLDQISIDLAKVETYTNRIDDELKVLYQEYLTVLGNAVKRQLVLAVYHLCTQSYPDDFLDLSLSQQEKMQASVRQIAAQGQSQIQQLGQVTDLSNLASRLEEAVLAKYESEELSLAESANEASEIDTPELDTPELDVPELEASATEASTWAAAAEEPSASSPLGLEPGSREAEPAAADLAEEPSTETPPPADQTLPEATQLATEMMNRLNTSLSLFSILGAEPLSPVSLAKRHVLLERHLRAILRTLSSLANHLLKQANILPDLPEMVIAAAAEAEGGEPGPSTPNLLNVLVEMGSDRSDDISDFESDDDGDEEDDDDDDDDDDEEEFDVPGPGREMTHLVAVNLRLADIEFADPHTALWRSRLQETLHKLKRLGSRYQKLQQEKARAEAEHAWRAIWFEE